MAEIILRKDKNSAIQNTALSLYNIFVQSPSKGSAREKKKSVDDLKALVKPRDDQKLPDRLLLAKSAPYAKPHLPKPAPAVTPNVKAKVDASVVEMAEAKSTVLQRKSGLHHLLPSSKLVNQLVSIAGGWWCCHAGLDVFLKLMTKQYTSLSGNAFSGEKLKAIQNIMGMIVSSIVAPVYYHSYKHISLDSTVASTTCHNSLLLGCSHCIYEISTCFFQQRNPAYYAHHLITLMSFFPALKAGGHYPNGPPAMAFALSASTLLFLPMTWRIRKRFLHFLSGKKIPNLGVFAAIEYWSRVLILSVALNIISENTATRNNTEVEN